MGFNAGDYNRRVEIQQATQTIDARGERTEVWAEYSKTWAKVEPLMGKGMFSADSEITESRMLFKIRYSQSARAIEADLFRVVYAGKNYLVELEPIDRDEMHEEILIRTVRRD